MSSSPNPPIPPSRSNSKSGVATFVAFALAIGCVALGIVALTLQGGKKAAEQEVAKLKGDMEGMRTELDQTKAAVSRVAAERDARILIANLPPELQGPRPSDALAKITQAYQTAKSFASPTDPSGGSSSGAGGGKPVVPVAGVDAAASAALEAVAKTVVAKSFDTKVDPGNDGAKQATHRQIQMVLSKIGAYSKPISGNYKDTSEAVLAFQKAHKLKVDGVVGRGTWGEVRKKFESLPKTPATANTVTPATGN